MKYSDAFVFDCHVHFGQYYDLYYRPSLVVKALYRNGVRRAWVSSTTACIAPDSFEEAQYLSRHIDDEVEEALAEAGKCGMLLVPLYWAVPKRYDNLDKVDGFVYAGFKIHPKIGEWDGKIGNKLLHDICTCAARKKFPILIHTGVDTIDSPSRFETYFANFPDVTFVLAHCQTAREVIHLFEKYDNLLGDTAFCPLDNYEQIYRAGFGSRMLWGTDFPITHWYHGIRDKISLSILTENYKNTLVHFKSSKI